MSTITREFTKEQLQQIIETDHVQCGEASSLARIALASLEAEPAIHRWRRVTSEPYGPYPWHYGDFIGFSKPVDGIEDEYFYSAPPAPAPAPAPAKAEPVAWLWSHRKHPSEVTLVRPEDDERSEGAHWSGWSCQALYAAPPAPVSVPDAIEPTVEAIKRILPTSNPDDYAACIGADMWNACRDAMLQGAENVESLHAVKAAPLLDSSAKGIELQHADFQSKDDGNSPVIPECSCHACRPVTFADSRFVVCPECGNKRCPHAIDHHNACTGSNEPGQEGSAYPAAPQQEVKP